MVERSAVYRDVTSSNLVRAANNTPLPELVYGPVSETGHSGFDSRAAYHVNYESSYHSDSRFKQPAWRATPCDPYVPGS